MCPLARGCARVVKSESGCAEVIKSENGVDKESVGIKSVLERDNLLPEG